MKIESLELRKRLKTINCEMGLVKLETIKGIIKQLETEEYQKRLKDCYRKEN